MDAGGVCEVKDGVHLVLIDVDPASGEASDLISDLDAELQELYPGEPAYGIDPVEFRRSSGTFLIARIDGKAVACGALRPLAEGVGELKRMYVRKDHRGNGLAKKIVQALEEVAVERGYRTIRLETGPRQTAAIGLYERLGYRQSPRFGDYPGDSLFFEKSLAAAEQRGGC